MTVFDVDKHVSFTLRLIEQGGLDSYLDAFAATVTRRRVHLREVGKGNGIMGTSVVQDARDVLARISKFKIGDLARVVSRRASRATYGVVGIVGKVNKTTLWIVPPDEKFPNLKSQWSYSKLSSFQRLKGFKVDIDNCEHHIPFPYNEDP